MKLTISTLLCLLAIGIPSAMAQSSNAPNGGSCSQSVKDFVKTGTASVVGGAAVATAPIPTIKAVGAAIVIENLPKTVDAAQGIGSNCDGDAIKQDLRAWISDKVQSIETDE